ncbi:MAG: hydroxymethylbilane synthase, partial [Acidobacteriia bacterium]|nr:hydroxymethylbilane synthase [Terriglobia bacterium]
DRDTHAPVAQLSSKGVFIKEIEDALLSGEADVAVHSMKDVPTAIPEGLVIAAVCEREDVRDAVISRSGRPLSELPGKAVIGTSSLRRQAIIKHSFPRLQVSTLRGNLNTRLRKLDEGQYDAILLARAGLVRLGWAGRITETLSTEVALPAVAQGAVGVECRARDGEIVALLSYLNHPPTAAAVEAERALLRKLEGGCQVPLGAWAREEKGTFRLDACVMSLDGRAYLRDRIEGRSSEAKSLGIHLAEKLLAQGADQILAEIRRDTGQGSPDV